MQLRTVYHGDLKSSLEFKQLTLLELARSLLQAMEVQ